MVAAREFAFGHVKALHCRISTRGSVSISVSRQRSIYMDLVGIVTGIECSVCIVSAIFALALSSALAGCALFLP